MQDDLCSDAQSRLQHLGESLINSDEGLSDTTVLELLEAFEERHLVSSHLAKLKHSAVAGREAHFQGSARSHADETMKLASRQLVITADEHRCSPGQAYVFAGGCVHIAVSSGPPQSFEIRNSATQDSDDTPRIPAGQSYEWRPAVPGTHTISSHIYPGCKAQVVVRSAVQPSSARRDSPQQLRSSSDSTTNGLSRSTTTTNGTGRSSSSSSMSQVDEPIHFPLRTSRGSQTDPVSSSSRFAATSAADLHLPPLGRAFQPAATPASVLPGITSAAAAAATSGLFASPEEEELGGGGLFGQTGLRRRSSSASSSQQQQRPSSAGSAESLGVHSMGPCGGTPDLGSSLGKATPAAEGPSAAASATSSQELPQGSPPRSAGPIFRPVRNMSVLQRPMPSPAGPHSAEETMPLLDIRMNNRVQHRPSSVFPSSGSRGALVSPTSVANRDATHKCPRCRKEFLSTINQRRCLAVHLGHKAAGAGGKAGSAKGGAMPDRAQLVEFWDGLALTEKQAVLDLKAEPGSEAVLRCMEMRCMDRDSGALTTEQRTMLAAGRTLFEVLVRSKGLESLSGEALATLLTRTSEGTFLYDRSLPARDESVLGYNAEAALSTYVAKRLVGALLQHRQQAAEKAQRELEELEEAQKGEKAKPGDKKKKDKKAKAKLRQKPAIGSKAPRAPASVGGTSLSRSSSTASLAAASSSELEDAASELLAGKAPAEEDSVVRAGRQPLEQPAAMALPAAPAAATAAAGTPARSSGAADSDMDLTPPPSNSRYTPTPEAERGAGRRPGAAVTYTNALYRAEGESGSWQPAGKGGSRGGGSRSGGDAPPRSNGAVAGGGSRVALRQEQQQQQVPAAAGAGLKGAQRPAPAAEHPAEPPGPAAKAVPAAAAAASHTGRPGAGSTSANPTTTEEAFPALPSKTGHMQKGAAPAAPAPAFSYAAAARPKAAAAAQQQRAAAAEQAEAASAQEAPPPPLAAPQQQPEVQQAPPAEAHAAAASSMPAPPPLPVVPASQAPVKARQAAATVDSSPSPPTSVHAQNQAFTLSGAEAPTPVGSPAVAAPLPPSQPAAAVQQLLALGSADGEEEGAADGSPGQEQAGQLMFELAGARSTTPPLEQDIPAIQHGLPSAPQDGPFPPIAPFGYPPPPVGYFYYPMPPVPAVQFGDVDMGEIMQQQQRERQQQQAFYPAYPPPPPPHYAAASPPVLPPFPPHVAMHPGHPMPPLMELPPMEQPLPVAAPVPGEATAPAVAPALPVQHAQLPVEAPVAAGSASQTEVEPQQCQGAGEAGTAGASCANAVAAGGEARALEAGLEAPTPPQQPGDPAPSVPQPGAAGPPVAKAASAEELAPVSQEAADVASAVASASAAAVADSRHLASMLRAAASAARQQPAFDVATAAVELASRWQAAIACAPPPPPGFQARPQQPGSQQAPLQRRGAFSRSSSGGSTDWGWRSRSPAAFEQQQQGSLSRTGSGGGGGRGQPRGGRASALSKSEWRPVLKEQPQPNLATGRGPEGGTWAAKGEQAPAVARANGASQRPSFAAVAGAGAKSSMAGGQGDAVATRGWSSEEAGDAPWKIQAAK